MNRVREDLDRAVQLFLTDDGRWREHEGVGLHAAEEAPVGGGLLEACRRGFLVSRGFLEPQYYPLDCNEFQSKLHADIEKEAGTLDKMCRGQAPIFFNAQEMPPFENV